MPTFRITAPDGATYEVTGPEGSTEQDALAQVQAQHSQAPKTKEQIYAASLKEQQAQQMRETPGREKFFAAMGAAPMNARLGIRQMMGAEYQSDVDETRRLEKPLMGTGAGKAGNIAGSLSMLAPTILVPGLNTVTGAGVVGAATGAMQPTAADESRLQNAVVGGAVGAGAQKVIGKGAEYFGNRLAAKETTEAARQSANSVKDATLKASQEAGYIVPPSTAGGSKLGRMMEGVSGKYKTNQAMAGSNQNTTDRLARQAVGLAEDAPITREAMQAIRNDAFERGYEPLAKAGPIETDRVFQKTLDKLVDDYQGAARSFPNATKSDVMERVDSLRTGAMDVGDALKMTRILRDEATAAYAQGNPALAKATKGASKAIEDQVERALEAGGKDAKEMLKQFREARVLMAKTHSVEKAIVEAGGQVNAKVLGAMLQRGKPLTDELKTIGAFANNFKDVAGVPQSGWANPITALDAFGVAGMSAMGAGPMAAALPAARMASRSALLSGAGQKLLARPSYGPNAAERLSPEVLDLLEKYGAGGLLGGAYASQ